MEYLDISLIILFFVLAYFYLNSGQKENFDGSLVDQYACYPGTYWRSKTYQNMCAPTTKRNPQRLTVDNESTRTPDSRYQLVCKTNQHLQRDCRLVKVHDKFY